MKTFEFIEKNIGQLVYITGDRDLGMCGELRPLIFNKTELTLLRLTKKGMVYLQDKDGIYYTAPPTNIRLISELT